MRKPPEVRNPFKLRPFSSRPLSFRVLDVLRLVVALGGLSYFLFLPMRDKAIRIQAQEPVAENRPDWVRFLELVQLIPPYSDLDRRPREPLQTGPPPPLSADSVVRRPLSAWSPTPNAGSHPLGKALTEAAREAALPELVVLDVDCGPTGEDFCIGWGMGSGSDNDLRKLMSRPSFVAYRGPVAEWAVSAVHWPSGRDGEPAFFALGIHSRELAGMHRTDFNHRSATLRTRFVEGAGARTAEVDVEEGAIAEGGAASP